MNEHQSPGKTNGNQELESFIRPWTIHVLKDITNDEIIIVGVAALFFVAERLIYLMGSDDSTFKAMIGFLENYVRWAAVIMAFGVIAVRLIALFWFELIDLFREWRQKDEGSRF